MSDPYKKSRLRVYLEISTLECPSVYRKMLDELDSLEKDRERFIKANAEVAAINADLVEKNLELEKDRKQKEAIKEIIDLWTVRKIRGFDAFEKIREILDRDGK